MQGVMYPRLHGLEGAMGDCGVDRALKLCEVGHEGCGEWSSGTARVRKFELLPFPWP